MTEGALHRDKRVQATREAAAKALVELVDEKGIGNFSVTELCKRAGLNRGTFYNHWKSVELLMWECEDAILEEVRAGILNMPLLTNEEILHHLSENAPIDGLTELFEVFRRHALFIHAVLRSDIDRRFYAKWREVMADSFSQHLMELHKDVENQRDLEYTSWFHAYALLGVVTKWALLGCEESSEEMSLRMMRMFVSWPVE